VEDATAVLNITRDLKSFLLNRVDKIQDPNPVIEDTFDSLYSIAAKRGVTLQQWVSENPAEILRYGQRIVASWEGVLQQAAITGEITTSVGNSTVTRETVRLIEKSVQNARDDLSLVNLMINTGRSDQARKDRIIEALYNKALQGDVKAATYIIDRVEGRIPEAIPQELDYNNAGSVFLIVHTLFDKQLQVLNCGPGTVMVCCSRKAGKTQMCAATLLIEALRNTNTTCLYIGETMQMAESLLDKAMNLIITKCNLRDSKGNRLNWKRLENGSEIIVRGLSNTKDPDLIRGINAKVIIIDEFFHLKSDLLEYMQQEVLEPMQLAYAQDYKLLLVGTPPKIKGTYGEKVWTNLDVPHFEWTVFENPYVPSALEFVTEKLREKGLDETSPWAQREYWGKWAYDEDALLYPEYHTWTEELVPTIMVSRILVGLDYGVDDNNAINGIAWSDSERRGFVFYESKFNRLTCDKNITMLQQLKKECRALWGYSLDWMMSKLHLSAKEANKLISWEADSSDQQLTQELAYNVKLDNFPELRMQIANAHKQDKIIMQDKIRDLLRTGNLLLPDGGLTAAECEMTVLMRDPQGNLMIEIDDKAFHPDLLPAMRYGLWPAVGLEVLDGNE